MSRVISSFWLFAALLLTTSCAQTQRLTPPEANTNEPVVSSSPPFQTKEPERYRATRTITTVTAAGETLVTQNRLARDGEMRRDEFEAEGRRLVYIVLPEGRIVLLPDEKLFAELGVADDIVNEANEYSDETERLLHTGQIASTYQRIGAETIGGRNTQKYRVVVNTSANANVSVSETVIWVDDALQMPIKSQTNSPNGARSTMELTDIALEVDRSLFRVPEGYQKITFEELLKRLQLD